MISSVHFGPYQLRLRHSNGRTCAPAHFNMSRNRVFCSVYGCLITSTSIPKVSFFKLPTQPARLSQWLELMCRDDLANKPNASVYRVCETHFNVQDVLPGTIRKVLKKNALPSLNLPDLKRSVQVGCQKEVKSTQTENTANESYTQTTSNLSCNTPRKRKLQDEILECNKRSKIHETENKTHKSEEKIFHKLCDKFLTKELGLLVKAQTTLKLHARGNRYDKDYIMFCLSLYFTSPQAYQFLQSALCLPCTTTLYKHSFPITTEINERTMSILKMKVEQMTEAEKKCSVIIDAMSLKENIFYNIKEDKIIGFHEVDGWQSPEPAKHALVMMVRGIFVNWKQPIAYALLSECRNCDEISNWVDKVLEKLLEIGLDIRAFVSDQGPDLLQAAKKRLITIEKPYFFINDRKIYYIFDAPHLIKDVRNNFMQYDFHFGNSVAKYKHIVQFYDQDIKKSCRLAHKLTNSHIKPTSYEKIKVCFATQLFSKSVATGISTYIDNNSIEESGRDTAKFITMMNDLFDSLNSSTNKHSYEHKRAYAGYESQTAFFTEMLCFFQDLKLINAKNGRNCTSRVKFIEGFQITITSLLLLFDDLRSEGYTFLFTRRFNQDALKSLFGQIRSKNGMSTNPTCRHFTSAFKKIYFTNLERLNLPKGANCSADFGKLLVQTYKKCAIAETTDETSNILNEESDSSVKIMSSDYNQLDMPEKNSLFYICDHLLKLCSEKHKDCQAFKSYISQSSHNFSAKSRYLRYRDYSKSNLQNCLIVPCDDFVEYVEEMEKIFRTSFKRKHVNCKISASIYEQIKEIPFSPPCSCFPRQFLIKLFIRLRIFYTLKSNNKALRKSPTRRKYFSVANL